jgi:hypothetical protein
MMEYTSNIMGFNWVGKEGHEGCQRDREFGATGTQEKKRDRGCFGDLGTGTGTQIVHWGTLAGESGAFGIAASVPKTS